MFDPGITCEIRGRGLEFRGQSVMQTIKSQVCGRVTRNPHDEYYG